MTKEITSIRFNKVPVSGDIISTTYIVGEHFFRAGMASPLKVISISYVNKTKRDRLLVEFEGGIEHEIGVTPDVEIWFENKKQEK